MSGGRSAPRLGKWGEALAAAYLEERGYTILARNYRSRYGELDLVASDGDFLAFVEVKLRRRDSFAQARESVDGRKQTKLRKTALCYLGQFGMTAQPRFDIMEIYAPQGAKTAQPRIVYWENAFQ